MSTSISCKDDEMRKAARNAIKNVAPHQIKSVILVALSSFRVPRHHRLSIMQSVVREHHLELSKQ